MKLRLIHRPETRCECGVEIWEVEKIKGRTMCSRVCKDCNPFWAVPIRAHQYLAARKQADELQEASA